MNHRARAHLCPLVTAFTPWGFSPPDEKPTILPHLGFTDAWRGWSRRSGNNSQGLQLQLCHIKTNTSLFYQSSTADLFKQVAQYGGKHLCVMTHVRPLTESVCGYSLSRRWRLTHCQGEYLRLMWCHGSCLSGDLSYRNCFGIHFCEYEFPSFKISI